MIRTGRTRTTFLHNLAAGETDAAWRELCALYEPVLKGVARHAGLQDGDADDVVQETLLATFGALSAGDYDRGRGRLRNWIRGIAANKLREHRRRLRRAEHASLSSDQPADVRLPDEQLDRAWDLAVLKTCLGIVREEVSGTTYQLFHAYALEGEPADVVAQRHGVTVNAVYIAKSRVLARLRGLQEDYGEPV